MTVQLCVNLTYNINTSDTTFPLVRQESPSSSRTELTKHTPVWRTLQSWRTLERAGTSTVGWTCSEVNVGLAARRTRFFKLVGLMSGGGGRGPPLAAVCCRRSGPPPCPRSRGSVRTAAGPRRPPPSGSTSRSDGSRRRWRHRPGGGSRTCPPRVAARTPGGYWDCPEVGGGWRLARSLPGWETKEEGGSQWWGLLKIKVRINSVRALQVFHHRKGGGDSPELCSRFMPSSSSSSSPALLCICSNAPADGQQDLKKRAPKQL